MTANLMRPFCDAPPSAPEVECRLLILLYLQGHAHRLMMLWDFGFMLQESMQRLIGQTPTWRLSAIHAERRKIRVRWRWRYERWAARRSLAREGLFDRFTTQELHFFKLGLTKRAREMANGYSWGIEAAACVAWALRLLPRIWPMDEQFDGKLDEGTLFSNERGLMETAALRPLAELEVARERVKLWHWRARQLALEREGMRWPPADASPKAINDLRAKGLDTLDGLVLYGQKLLAASSKPEIF